MISRQVEEETDPVMIKFLDFLEKDMRDNPHHIQPLPASLMSRVDELTAGVDIDLNAPVKGEDDE